MFAEVVFPLPFKISFTYQIPKDLIDEVKIGVRVVVPFGRRIMTGFVINLSSSTNYKDEIKNIRDVLDDDPIFDLNSLKFYKWLSEYYLCTLGEALRHAIPYGSDVESKLKIIPDRELCKTLLNQEKTGSTKWNILTALSNREKISIIQLQRDIKKKNIYSILRGLQKNGIISIYNELTEPKVREKKIKYLKLSKSIDDTYLSLNDLEKKAPKQLLVVLELISAEDNSLPMNEVIKKSGSNSQTITALVNKGLVTISEEEVERSFIENYKEEKQNLVPTTDQLEVINKVKESMKENQFHTFLLHGVTGSGKTQIYIELCGRALEENKSVLILVPEISLTPQITSRFTNNFGNKVAVLHSRMSLGERYDNWRGIISGKYNIVIGARSALFAPLKNIGIIIVDEEHDSSYKNFETIPRYNARDSAVVRGKMEDAVVLLGSATPSVESMYNTQLGKYSLLELKNRIDDAKLPKIKLVNISTESKKDRYSGVFTSTLIHEIKNRLDKKESVIILQNRRGFATQIYCADCGTIEICQDCSIPMVHHINKNILKCHYCGYTKPVPKACSVCASNNLRHFGTGTQKVEDELEYFIPGIRIKRIDSDSINKKGELSNILNDFSKGKYDVLIGTQMVAKGLDFSKVTLVGVITAETTLWLPDFRADERTFQLLTQVAGRAGRSKDEGEVLIQTFNEDNFILQKVIQNDYQGFYEREIKNRSITSHPPFSRLCLIEIKDENEQKSRAAINHFFELLKSFKSSLIISTPSGAVLYKIRNFYRNQILIKSLRKDDNTGQVLRNIISNSIAEFNKESKFRDIKIIIDVDPQSIL